MIANNNGHPANPPGLVIDETRISARRWMRIDLDDLRRQTGMEPDEQQAMPLDHDQMQAAQAIRRADHAARRAPRAARIGTRPADGAASSEGWSVTRLDDEKRQRALARAQCIIPKRARKPAPAGLIPPRHIIAVGGVDLRTAGIPLPCRRLAGQRQPYPGCLADRPPHRHGGRLRVDGTIRHGKRYHRGRATARTWRLAV